MSRRGNEYNRGTGCRKTARPGLCGECWVTGIPTTTTLIITLIIFSVVLIPAFE